ncbi:MAG: single-stranded-DNA-specific exonuclease RecJ [Weeksellaceae bacterium]|jgi:single-stranded-DNA-specific exonuclease|nr:single-stranded-DNA-specific exonuclease RecJ [Weeksellaceae bacterium]
MKNQWVMKPAPELNTLELLMKEVRLSVPIATILAQRGINTYEKAKAFFRPEKSHLHNPFLMKDMDKAVDRILHAIESNQKIMVYGDYDVDGTTSVAMVYDFLRSIYPNIQYYIPDRYKEGYGISFQGIDQAEKDEISLIIALDCGIKAIDKVDYALSKNIDFIICDHHLPSETLPKAFAVLDPKRKDCSYPFKELSGCGVGFKLIQGIAIKKEISEEIIFNYLDLVAVSIAADIVSITGENRVLAHYGLEVLRKSPRPGIKALLGEISAENISISNIVFSVAPRINASGRLEHASQSVKLLISNEKSEISTIFSQIDELNKQRKEKDENITVEAIQLIKDNKEEERFSTIVYHPEWHKGVLGIVASRLIETYYRPTLVLTKGNEGEITGSARSVKDFDIYEVIDACSDLLIRYGGHQFAAGLTLAEENLEKFKEKFEFLVKEKIQPIQRIPSLEIDVEIPFSSINTQFVNVLNQIKPYGPGNMTPLFLTRGLIGGFVTKMGKNNEHLRLDLKDKNGITFKGVAFGMSEFIQDFQYGTFDIVYSIDENHWKNKTYLQLNIRDVHFT